MQSGQSDAYVREERVGYGAYHSGLLATEQCHNILIVSRYALIELEYYET